MGHTQCGMRPRGKGEMDQVSNLHTYYQEKKYNPRQYVETLLRGISVITGQTHPQHIKSIYQDNLNHREHHIHPPSL